MPTDLEQQLPRFAKMLDREAPTVSVDEILRRGTVAVDVDRPQRSRRGSQVGAVSWGDATSGRGGDGEHGGSIEVAPIATEPPARRRVALQLALAAAAAAVLVVAIAAVPRIGDEPGPAEVPPSTAPAPPPTVVDSFVGVWLSTDTDGSSQTMEIVRSGTAGYEVVMRDETATMACAGGASTTAGVARLVTGTSLVIARPELTCDDGTIPPIGPAPQAELADFTLDLDPATGQLVDSFAVVWQREGADDVAIEPSPNAAPGSTPATAPANEPSTEPSTSGGMWPQSTLAEVRAAQERADAGDADYTWQVDPRLIEEVDPGGDDFDSWMSGSGQVELVGRFLREVLGWDAYLLKGEGDEGVLGSGEPGVFTLRYLRCAPGRTNPLYPPGPEPDKGELCAPTIDDLRYESVSLDLAQLDRQGRDGIWVIRRWELTAPFAQADPAVAEATARERVEEFLAARIAGTGAEGQVETDPASEVPLLYATTSGAPYERSEIERVDGPGWPYGNVTFTARLYADGDATVVEQEISWWPGFPLRLDTTTTTEAGAPVVLSYTSSDGDVSVSVPSTWETWSGGGKNHGGAPDLWFWEFARGETIGQEDRIDFTDPVAYDAWCAEHGGSPLLSGPADAAAIAQELIADPDFETTAPVATSVGGREAVVMDVTLAPGGRSCGVGMIVISRWIHVLWEPGWRLRLYLVDLPEGMSVPTLAITVVAPEERFEDVVAETAPIIESIEFHPG